MTKKFILGGLAEDSTQLCTIDLPTLMETRVLIQAQSGGGKSYLVRKLLEMTYGHVPQIVLDVEDDFATLREIGDYVLAGKDRDIPISLQTAELLPHKILELGCSIVISLYDLKKSERSLYVKRFLESLVEAPKELRRDVLVLLDEAHLFAPEKEKSISAEAVIDVASRGRKRGICLIAATQRISRLSKDVAAECGNKFIGRTGLDVDMKRAAYELGFTSRAQELALRKLKPGQFFAFGAALTEEIKLVQIGSVKSTHPTRGQKMKTKAPVPTHRVKEILSKLEDLPQEAQAELKDRHELQARVRELEAALKRAQAAQPAPGPSAAPEELEKARQAGAAHAQKVLHQEHRIRLENVSRVMTERLGSQVEVVKQLTGSLQDTLQKLQKQLVVPVVELEPLPPTMIPPYDNRPRLMKAPKPLPVSPIQITPSTGWALPTEKAMLKFLASRPGGFMNRSQIAAATCYSKKSSGFSAALTTLKKSGLVQQEGDRFCVPREALEAVRELLGGDFESPAGSLEAWKSKLSPCPRAIYEILLKDRREHSQDELCEQTGYSLKSSGFSAALTELKSLGLLVKTPTGVVLNPDLPVL
jgi:hypothetical protein